MSEGFYKRRRGALEHIDAGTIDLLDDGIHDYLSMKANLVIGNGYKLPAGVVKTSAAALHAKCKCLSERTIQRRLNHMEEIGWLKFSAWRTPGKRGNYVVVICRASVHDLSGKEYRVNGEKTTDWRHPVCEPVGDVSGTCPQDVGEVSGYREVEREKREKKHPAAKPAPPDVPSSVWVEFVEHRQKLRRPLTVHAAELVKQKLEKLKAAGHDPTQLLETAIERGWLTVFEPDEKRGKQNGEAESFAERNIRRAQEELGDVSRRAQQALSHVGGDLPEPPGHKGDGRVLPISIERPNTRAN